MDKQTKKVRFTSKGQSLIETIAALGLLTTGIIGGLTLAAYAFGASDVSLKQIIATNLAREGIEVIRNRRDTNWLAGTLSDCSAAMGSGQECFTTWTNAISGTPSGRSYRVNFNANNNTWSIINPASGQQTRLYLQSNGIFTSTNNGNWLFSRRVVVTEDRNAPFSNQNPRLVVRSEVWWQGKNCPATDNPGNTTCKVVVEEYLTNWKNYE